jgi:hypothetical protein
MRGAVTAPPNAPAVARLPYGFAPALLISFLFGLSILYSRGAYSEQALLMVLLGFLASCWSFAGALGGERVRMGHSTMLLGLLWSGLFGMAFYAWNDPAIIVSGVQFWELGRTMQLLTLILLLSYLPFIGGKLKEHRVAKVARFTAFGAVLCLSGYDTIRSSPRPWIDVWELQQRGAEYLERGENPYPKVAVRDTGPRRGEDVPYAYPPTHLYATFPAFLIGKDVRFAMLAALLIAGLALRFIVRRSGLGLTSLAEDAPALFIWLSPKLQFVLELAWVDPVQAMWIALMVSAHVAAKPTLAAALLGVAAGSKQTMFWLVPLAGLMLGWNRRQWLITSAVAIALPLPFILADFQALKYANFDYLNALPARPDALTFTNWFARKYGTEIPGNIAFLLAAAVAGVSIWKLRGSTARFGLGLLATYVTFFVFNRWAFANYYFLLCSLSALAAACACHAPELTAMTVRGLKPAATPAGGASPAPAGTSFSSSSVGRPPTSPWPSAESCGASRDRRGRSPR